MDFTEFQLGLYHKWARRILRVCWWETLAVAVFELICFFFFFRYHLLPENIPLYIVLRMCIPSGINLSVSLAATLILRDHSRVPTVKNYTVSFASLIISAVIAIFHNYYRFLLLAPGIPVFMCAIFADHMLQRRISIGAVGAFVIAAAVMLAEPGPEPAALRIVTLIICFGILWFCAIFSKYILQSQEEQLDFIYSGYQKQLELIHELRIDPLTRLYNRTALRESLDSYIKKADEQTHMPYLVLIDLDHFKQINDRFGHMSGDAVLIRLGQLIRDRMGGMRHAFRYGGEEFVLLFEDRVMEDIVTVVESIRTEFMSLRFEFAPFEQITLSAGIARYERGLSRREWFNKADVAMYRAKRDGRNSVSVESEQTSCRIL
jgi:diguanylate cyclase (GGDEF)-like protein